MKDRLGEKSYLLDGYDENNIFPASYIVTAKLLISASIALT